MAFLRFHLIQGSSYHCKGDHVYQMTSMMSLHLLYRLLVSLQGRDNAYQQYCLLICPPPPFGLLTSTVNLQQHNVFCPPRPIENTVDNTLVSHNVSQVSSDSRLEMAEEHVDNVIESVTDTSAEDSGPSWNETPAGIHPSAEESIIDPVPRCHLELYNQQEPYYYLGRGGTQNGTDCIVQLPAGYIFIKDKVQQKTGRLAWRCIDSKKKNGPGCNCRITTPVDYDNTNEPDERKVDLQVQGSTTHLCNPNGAAYVAIRLKREQIRLGLLDHSRTGLSADMPRAGLPSLENMKRDRAIAPKKALYALCQETERNNIMTYNRDMMSYTCLDIDKCDVFDE